LSSIWVRSRLLFVFGIGLMLVAIEMINHYDPLYPGLYRPEFWYFLPVYAIVLPLLFGLLHVWLRRGEESRARKRQRIDLQSILEKRVVDSAHLDELAPIIVQYLGAVTGAKAVSLSLYNSDLATFSPTARWHPDGTTLTHLPALSLEECTTCLRTRPTSGESIMQCPVSNGQQTF
jgi:hypothetical protein